MAKILIATVPILGHVSPFSPLAKGLVARGHEVLWYTGAKYADRATRAGARYLPFVVARDYDDADPFASAATDASGFIIGDEDCLFHGVLAKTPE